MNVPSKLLPSCILGLALTAGAARAQTCNPLVGGSIVAADGVTVLGTGFDAFGYNYEARMFNGPYACYARDAAACAAADPDHELIMKWNDAWLSNTDCTGDGRLDRHLGSPGYAGSGAWITNHQSGVVWVNGKAKRWTYFAKFVAVPEDAVLSSGSWYTAQGALIGPAIWGPFAIIEEVYNDPSQGVNGLLYKAAVAPGFGTFQP